MFDDYGEKVGSTPIATPYETGLNTLTAQTTLDEVTLKVYVLKEGSTLRTGQYDIIIGDDYELDFREDVIKEVNRAEPEPVVTQPEETEETTEESENNESDQTDETGNSTISGFVISDLNNNYIYITATAIILAGIAAFVVVKNKKKGPKIGKEKKQKTNHVIEKIKKKVSKEDHELREIQDKIKQRQQMILQLKKEKERTERLKQAKTKLEDEEKELRKLLREQKEPK